MVTPVLLIVEDNLTQQFVIKQLCERFDYAAHLVATGEEAIAALSCANYAAVLLDVTLPGMDGLECARQIRLIDKQNQRHTPIIAVTARASQEDRTRCLEAGMDDYIKKPFDIEVFRGVLLRWAYEPSRPNLKLLKPYRSEPPNSQLR